MNSIYSKVIELFQQTLFDIHHRFKGGEFRYTHFLCIPIAPIFPELISMISPLLEKYELPLSLLPKLHFTGLLFTLKKGEESIIIEFIKQALREFVWPTNKTITLGKLSCFGEIKNARVLYLDMIGPMNDAFLSFNSSLAEIFRDNGILTKAADILHLTLSKSSVTKTTIDCSNILSESFQLPPLTIPEIRLVSMKIDQTTHFYETIQTFPLQ